MCPRSKKKMETSKADDLTILVKTFLRPQSCLRLVESFRSFFPSLPLLIADDSDDAHSVARVEGLGPTTVFQLPFDSGVSVGRNFLLQKATSPFVTLLDDDFIFTRATQFHEAVDFLYANPDIDLVAGGFEDGYVIHGALEETGDVLTFRKGVPSGISEQGHPLFDMVPNFFVARREKLPTWDPALKTCEHVEYFLRAKRTNTLRCTYLPSLLEAIHDRTSDSSPRYASFRFGRTRHFGALSWEKMGIQERLIIGVDGTVEQHSVFRREEGRAGTRGGMAVQWLTKFLREPKGETTEEGISEGGHVEEGRMEGSTCPKKAEVLARDEIFRATHCVNSQSLEWPSEDLIAPSEDPTVLMVQEIFSKEILAREFFRIKGVIPITKNLETKSPVQEQTLAEDFQESPEKLKVFSKFQKLRQHTCPASEAKDSSVAYTWLGVSPELCQHIYNRGSIEDLQSAADPTQGTLGPGFYSTLHPPYACLYAMGLLGYRNVSPCSRGYSLVLCRVCTGRVYPVTRGEDYQGRSRHPGPGPRCDFWGEGLAEGFDAHVGYVSEGVYWQVCEDKEMDEGREEGQEVEFTELVVGEASRMVPIAIVFFQLAPQYQ
jgi:hypothetical protein